MKFKNLQYYPSSGAIATKNGNNRNNRPLYMKDGIYELVLTGDNASVSVSTGQTFDIVLSNNEKMKSICEFNICEVLHRPNCTAYHLNDELFPNINFTVEIYPAHDGYGFIAALCAFGITVESITSKFCVAGNADTYKCIFSEGNADVRENCTDCTMRLENGKKYIAAVSLRSQTSDKEKDYDIENKNCITLYELAAQRCEALREHITVSTPDEYFNTAVPFAASALDGTYVKNPPVFYHGGMGWREVLLGWKTMPGFTYLGWHERVQTSIKYYLDLQHKDNCGASDTAVANDSDLVRMSRQAGGSRVFGKGHIPHGGYLQGDQYYNMQTQFFDAAIDEWRATGDKSTEESLLAGLRLHLERAKECFDPDNDGLYESYVNVLPTDSLQYNGGGTVEESSYIYKANIAAAQLCERFGDSVSQQYYLAEAEKIRNALVNVLYLADDGYMASWREQNPPYRIHKDAWLYSEFLPIHHGLIDGHKAVSSLFYTEWALERVEFPCGGKMSWNSNWVPQKWSTRWFYSADNYALAEAYFRTGLGDMGWELIKGNILQSSYCLEGAEDAISPGGFSYGNGEENAPCVDASDITNSFVPAIVCGMFGYHPDYPNGNVEIAPAFPSCWTYAGINTEDFSLKFERIGTTDIYNIALKRAAKITLRLQVRACDINNVNVNGISASYEIIPWYECTVLKLDIDECTTVKIDIVTIGQLPKTEDKIHEYELGDEIELRAESIDDMQNCLNITGIENGTVRAKCAKNGHYTVFSHQTNGELPLYRIHKLHIKDSVAQALREYKTPVKSLGGKFIHIDLSEQYSASIENIFRQKYLSPRKNTCSTRIGTDGYSSWTYLAWGKQPPQICFDVPLNNKIYTESNVPFVCGNIEKNIIFTSVWDNWDTKVEVPINRSADIAWVLICGSTNCMQGKIENALLEYVYTDGTKEVLPLIHPQNFWTLAHTCDKDYDYTLAGFPLPKNPPPQVQLGKNCRAMILSMRLDKTKRLEKITLECLSEDVIVGIMGISLEVL